MQGASADALLRCKHALHTWHDTNLRVSQQLQDAVNQSYLQSRTCAKLRAELSSIKASQAELECRVQSWRQRAVHAEQQLKADRHQIELLSNMLPQQDSAAQVGCLASLQSVVNLLHGHPFVLLTVSNG